MDIVSILAICFVIGLVSLLGYLAAGNDKPGGRSDE